MAETEKKDSFTHDLGIILIDLICFLFKFMSPQLPGKYFFSIVKQIPWVIKKHETRLTVMNKKNRSDAFWDFKT